MAVAAAVPVEVEVAVAAASGTGAAAGAVVVVFVFFVARLSHAPAWMWHVLLARKRAVLQMGSMKFNFQIRRLHP